MARPSNAKLLSLLRWLLLLPIPMLWCLLESYGTLTFLENKSVDWRFKYRGEISSPVKIVYADLDTLSLSDIGGWPWNRGHFAKVTSTLISEAKVKAVGFDVVFNDLGQSETVDYRQLVLGNAEFGRYLIKQPPVVLAASYAGKDFLDILGHRRRRELPLMALNTKPLSELDEPELPSFETSADRSKSNLYHPPVAIGLIDTLSNNTRTVPLWTPKGTKDAYYHISVELARLYWGLPKGSVRVKGDDLQFVKPDGSLQATVPMRFGQLLDINWFTQWDSDEVSHHPFAEIYEYVERLKSDNEAEKKKAKEFFALPEFRDAIVLVGPVDPFFQDLAPTSLDDVPVPKVGVHANVLKTIVGGEFLQRLPPNVVYLIIFSLTIIVATLALAGGARALFAKLVAVLAFGIYVALAFRLFEQTHLILPFTAPLGAALTTSFAGLIWQVIDEQKAKARVKGMFGAYVSPQLVERMVESGEDPQLGGHDAEITAYFSDIQSFSSFSEKLGSGPLVELMNEYLTACTDLVQSQGGTLDKYIGDAVVAMFGAPIALKDHAARACVTTQLVHQKLGELREKWKHQGDKWPEIVWKMQSRIGLNTGVCMIGNMGSRTRFNYTMMGDNVNLAARMESGAKSWGAYTMVTETTKKACQEHGGDRVVFRPLGRIVVMGRSQPVPIYEIVGLKESLPANAPECIGLFEQALAKHYARDWDGAIALFKQSQEFEPNQPGKTPGVKTNPSKVYIEITEGYKVEPPAENWDGVFHMKEK